MKREAATVNRTFVAVIALAVSTGASAEQSSREPRFERTWHVRGESPGAALGAAIAGNGDVNGDGFDDVLIGGAQSGEHVRGDGVALLFPGGGSGLRSEPAWRRSGEQRLSYFGAALAFAGDVNGDGFDDVIIGAPFHDGTEPSSGRALLFLGSPTGLEPEPAWSAEGRGGSRFGAAVASAGDVNGDGFADVIVGAPGHDGDQIQEGQVRVYLGSRHGLSPMPHWTADGNQARSRFGHAVSAGDLNADGYSDVAVGAYLFERRRDGRRAGAVFVYRGSRAGPEQRDMLRSEGIRFSRFGETLSSSGDLDGDGRDDLATGASEWPDARGRCGAVFALGADDAGLGRRLVRTGEPESLFGSSVCVIGDVDGDGVDELVVAGARSPITVIFSTRRGRPYSLSEVGSSSPGALVANAGDVDGDGTPEILVARPRTGHDQNRGAVAIYRIDFEKREP